MQTFQVQGTNRPQFDAVRQAFEANFREHGEVGAAVAVFHRGECVVDLWGGLRSRQEGLPWQEDTIVCMMSVAKGIAATAMAMVCDRGLVDLDAPVARYWPEFAANGKAEITVRHVLSHLAGLPVIDAVEEGDIYDFEKMAAGLAAQAPLWPVGSRMVYHSATAGYFISKIIQGVTGKTLGKFVREEISGPLGADFQIGLTPEEMARCATVITSPNSLVLAAKRAPVDSMAYRAWKGLPADETFNSERFRAAEIPSVNGHGSARGVARIYAALSLGGTLDGVRLGSAETFRQFATEQGSGKSETSGLSLRMGMGYMLSSSGRPMGPHPETFGFSGSGGHQAFADPVAELSFAYCCNNMHDGIDIGPRAQALIDATFGVL